MPRALLLALALLSGCNKNTTVNQYGGNPPEEKEASGGSESEEGGTGGSVSENGGSKGEEGGAGGETGTAGTGAQAGGTSGSSGSGGQEKKYVPEVYFDGNSDCLACINNMSGKLNGSGPSCGSVAGCLSTIVDTTVDLCQKGADCIGENKFQKSKSWGCTLTVCEPQFDGQTSKFWECVSEKCATQCSIKTNAAQSPPWVCP